MTTTSLCEAAKANMVSTYLSIAAASPGAELYRSTAWVGCRSSFSHSIANFAIILDPAKEHRMAAQNFLFGRPTACVYGVRDDASADGPRGGRCLKLMASKAVLSNSIVEMVQAISDVERSAVADFMVAQFFGANGGRLSEILAASSSTGEAPIYWLAAARRRIGALMLNADAGVLGVYNFCIDRRSRGKGFGSQTLAAISSIASRAGLDLTLQCSPDLVPFYSKHNYEIVGHVDIWSLECAKSAVIMGGR